MEITNRVHLLENTKGSYSYLVMGQEPVLVDISIPGRANRIVDALANLGMRPTDLAHNCTDPPRWRSYRKRQAAEGTFTCHAVGSKGRSAVHPRRGVGIRRIVGSIMKVDKPRVDKLLEVGQHVGNLEIIPAPGHTQGHVCFRVEDVLLAGDLVTTRGGKLRPSPGFLTWDKGVLSNSIRSVGQLKFDWICPAHGDPVKRGSLWEALVH